LDNFLNVQRKAFIRLGFVGSVKDLPSRWSLVDLSGCSTTLELEIVPSSVLRQQWRILGNQQVLDPVTLR